MNPVGGVCAITVGHALRSFLDLGNRIRIQQFAQIGFAQYTEEVEVESVVKRDRHDVVRQTVRVPLDEGVDQGSKGKDG